MKPMIFTIVIRRKLVSMIETISTSKFCFYELKLQSRGIGECREKKEILFNDRRVTII